MPSCMSLLRIGFDRIDFNGFVGLNRTITMSISNIMCYKQALGGIHVAEAAVGYSVAAAYLMMELPIGPNFVAIVVRA